MVVYLNLSFPALRTYKTALVGSMQEPYAYYAQPMKRKMMGASPMPDVKRSRDADYMVDNWQTPGGSGNYVQ